MDTQLLGSGRYRRAARLVLELERRHPEVTPGEIAPLLEALGALRGARPSATWPGASLSIFCLGSFDAWGRGRRLTISSGKRTRSLLQYLVLHRHCPTPKEVLMELWWPDRPSGAARNSLNVTVHSLRKCLREAAGFGSMVLFQDGCYLLDPEVALWVDVEEFEVRSKSASGLRDWRAAASLYRGPLFEDQPYEEWAEPRRRELERAFLDCLERIAAYHREAGHVGANAAVARRILKVDLCCEAAHRDLMRCYWRQGQHQLAFRQFRECCEALGRELGIGPSRETMELRDRLRGRVPARRRASIIAR